MANFYEKVGAEAERCFQLDDMLRSHESFFLLLSEEVGEVAKAMNEDMSVDELASELVQVAMLCKVWHDILLWRASEEGKPLVFQQTSGSES